MKFDTNKMTAPVNALLAAALSVFIYYISARSVGVVRLLLYFPLTTLYIVEGIYWAGAATMLCVAAIAMLFGAETGISLGLHFLVMSFAIGIHIKRKKALFHEIVFPALLFAALSVALLFMTQWLTGQDVLALLREEMQNITQQVMELAEQQNAGGVLPPGAEVLLRRSLEAMLNLLPAFLFVEGLLTAIVTSFFSHLLLSHTEEDVARFCLADFHITRKISGILLVLAAIGMMLSLWVEPFAYLGTNIGTGVLVLYALHGVARIDEQLSRLHVPKVLRVILYFFAVLFVFLTVLFVLVGFLLSFLYERNPIPEGGNHE